VTGAAPLPSFTGERCVLCGVRPSSPKGEHVLPQWYLRSGLHGPGPYAWELNGESILRRDGTALAPEQLTRVQLPMCPPCNNVLEHRFERVARPLILRLFSDRSARFDDAEARIVSLWLLKTWLLLCHPKVRYEHPAINSLDIIRKRPAFPESCYRWMIDGSEPPDGLSLWLARHADDRSDRSTMLAVPIVEADGSAVRFAAHEAGLHGLSVSVAFHPGWPIDYPGAAEGRVAQLLPDPKAIDLGLLPVLANEELPLWDSGWRVVLRDGVLGSPHLRPLKATNPMLLPRALLGLATLVRRIAN
jgi:hypothetical protein